MPTCIYGAWFDIGRPDMKTLEAMLADLDDEIIRSKLFVSNNGYHHGTAINQIVSRYRNELKEYRMIVSDDLHLDGIVSYRDCEG